MPYRDSVGVTGDRNHSSSNTEERCPECGGLRGGHSNRRCSLMTLGYAQQEIINVEQRWIKLTCRQSSVFQKEYDRLKKSISNIQGKISVLKHENNQLRKKIKKGNEN